MGVKQTELTFGPSLQLNSTYNCPIGKIFYRILNFQLPEFSTNKQTRKHPVPMTILQFRFSFKL